MWPCEYCACAHLVLSRPVLYYVWRYFYCEFCFSAASQMCFFFTARLPFRLYMVRECCLTAFSLPSVIIKANYLLLTFLLFKKKHIWGRKEVTFYLIERDRSGSIVPSVKMPQYVPFIGPQLKFEEGSLYSVIFFVLNRCYWLMHE